MSITLYPYQQDIITRTRDHLRKGIKSVLVQLPTGGGKTALSAVMCGTASGRGKRVWFVVHRRELIKQSSKTFHKADIAHGIVAAGFSQNAAPLVQVCSIQTVAKRLDALAPPDMIIWDEAHHIAATSWGSVFERYPNIVHVGLSATPSRLDGRGLGQWFKVMVQGPTSHWLIENSYLSNFRLFAPPSVDVSQVHMFGGDFNKKELVSALDKSSITGDAVSHYRKFAAGKRAVVFEASVERSKRIVEQFRSVGIAAEHVDGETEAAARDLAIERFTRGETLILSNVDLFGEGFDLPAIEVAILLRPTKSLSIYLQQVGRCLRTSPGKTQALILDHAGNCSRHGMPDEEREWTLEGRTKRGKSESEVQIRQCPECFYVQKPFVTECENCGHIYAPKKRGVLEVNEGTLVEVDREALKRKQRAEQAQADTLQSLIELGKARGMNNPHGWARYVWNARQAKRARV